LKNAYNHVENLVVQLRDSDRSRGRHDSSFLGVLLPALAEVKPAVKPDLLRLAHFYRCAFVHEAGVHAEPWITSLCVLALAEAWRALTGLETGLPSPKVWMEVGQAEIRMHPALLQWHDPNHWHRPTAYFGLETHGQKVTPWLRLRRLAQVINAHPHRTDHAVLDLLRNGREAGGVPGISLIIVFASLRLAGVESREILEMLNRLLPPEYRDWPSGSSRVG
jgi:hypothetical protein